jgi:hypothetical protein
MIKRLCELVSEYFVFGIFIVFYKKIIYNLVHNIVIDIIIIYFLIDKNVMI